jgi:hypothetical protein
MSYRSALVAACVAAACLVACVGAPLEQAESGEPVAAPRASAAGTTHTTTADAPLDPDLSGPCLFVVCAEGSHCIVETANGTSRATCVSDTTDPPPAPVDGTGPTTIPITIPAINPRTGNSTTNVSPPTLDVNITCPQEQSADVFNTCKLGLVCCGPSTPPPVGTFATGMCMPSGSC